MNASEEVASFVTEVVATGSIGTPFDGAPLSDHESPFSLQEAAAGYASKVPDEDQFRQFFRMGKESFAESIVPEPTPDLIATPSNLRKMRSFPLERTLKKELVP